MSNTEAPGNTSMSVRPFLFLFGKWVKNVAGTRLIHSDIILRLCFILYFLDYFMDAMMTCSGDLLYAGAYIMCRKLG